MKALTWHGKRDVRVDTVPDPRIEKPTDAIVRITSTAICGSDLHLYEVLGPFLEEGDILGQMSSRIAAHRGARVITVDLVAERLEMARRHGIETLDLNAVGDVGDEIRALTDGRGADSTIDAVGMEAHGSKVAKAAQAAAGLLPDAVAAPLIETAGIDRLAALNGCIDAVRRGGTVSISGVYGGMADPLPLMTLFDKGVQVRMGQAHVKRWIDDILPLLEGDGDPLGVEDLKTHTLPLAQAPRGYEVFQKQEDGAIKVVLKP